MKERQYEFGFLQDVIVKSARKISPEDKLKFVTENIDLFTGWFDDGLKNCRRQIAELARKEFKYSDKTIDWDVAEGFRKAYKTYIGR